MTGPGDPNEPWPWDQAPNVAAITTQSVLDGAPVLLVSHDEEDDGWQFLDGVSAAEPSAGRLLAMREVLRLDPSLREIADLPSGWTARRHSVGGGWTRSPAPPDPGGFGLKTAEER